ncbi:Protein kinase superfamily protein [Trifolium repens]|nr:Protein kinase superfamily protein [Trifolium repens]
MGEVAGVGKRWLRVKFRRLMVRKWRRYRRWSYGCGKATQYGSDQGEREFQAEVEILSCVHHRHVVRLIGYCNDDHHRLLVFEFVDNQTLHFHLHGAGSTLDWQTRFKIGVGCAKGFEYLHEYCDPMIIHRDIKTTNILLNSNFEAKLLVCEETVVKS